MHPKQEAHERLKQALQDQKDIRARNTKLWTETLKLRYVHVRDEDFLGMPVTKGGMTVAYTLPQRHNGKMGKILKVATTIVHENDVFCKREGRYRAAMAYARGNTIELKVPNGYTPATFLKVLFEAAV